MNIFKAKTPNSSMNITIYTLMQVKVFHFGFSSFIMATEDFE